MLCSHRKSIKHLSQQLNIAVSTYRIIPEDVKLFLYKIQQAFCKADARIVDFCNDSIFLEGNPAVP
jgi:hypothetical protein